MQTVKADQKIHTFLTELLLEGWITENNTTPKPGPGPTRAALTVPPTDKRHAAAGFGVLASGDERRQRVSPLPSDERDRTFLLWCFAALNPSPSNTEWGVENTHGETSGKKTRFISYGQRI